MTVPIQFWSDIIEPGSQPVFIFPLLVTTLHVQLQMFAEDGVTDGLQSTGVLSGGITPVIDGQSDGLFTPGSGFTDVEKGLAIGDPILKDHPLAGQLANLNVKVSKDGAAFVVGTGVLAEISDGFYKYTVAAAETDTPGSLLVRVYPTDPLASALGYISETIMNARIKAPGPTSTNATPSSIQNALIGPGGPFDDLKTFIRSAVRDLLGNQMTNKPTYKKE